MNLRTGLIHFGIVFIAILLAAVLFVWHQLRASLPDLPDKIQLIGLESTVSVESDKFGIPTILASTRLDASRILGFMTARDRLFQVDLMRRRIAGRLAEIFGDKALGMDIHQRRLGLHRVVKPIFENLPQAHKQILQASAEGFNAFLSQVETLPFEFLVLDYQPEPWTVEDSISVALTMFQQLTWNEHDERMLTVMNETLPPEVVTFLTPDNDTYDSVLVGGPNSRRSVHSVPVKDLASIPLSMVNGKDTNFMNVDAALVGSNNWAVNGTKTADGRAILANDMHLELSVPNIWYRVVIHYGTVKLSGMMLPGLPLLIVGTNNKVAWGHTNIMADVIDLVSVEINPDNASEYLTLEGWKPFDTIKEVIRIKDGKDQIIAVKNTIWGPLSPYPLLGHPVAIRWTALQPDAVNLEMLNLDDAETLEQAIKVLNRAGIPPTHVVLADNQGRIAWTVAGKFPLRVGFDGSVSRFWSNNKIGWKGFIEPNELPKVIAPANGYLMTANNRTMGSEYPYVIGHNFAFSYRAFRIGERLKEMKNIRENDLLQLQLDTNGGFYEFYRDLALSVLTKQTVSHDQALKPVRKAIEKWDGKANKDSLGLPILVEFRTQLAKRVIMPYLGVCKAREPSFSYQWFKMDTPLRKLLTEKIPETLPNRQIKDWDELITNALKQSAADLQARFSIVSVMDLTWGQTNKIKISHPLSRAIPLLSNYLDMPVRRADGCSFCVKVIRENYGASERMVISPGNAKDGILHMPAGQSGHPLSPHYDDQQPYWEKGLPMSFDPGPSKNTLLFVP